MMSPQSQVKWIQDRHEAITRAVARGMDFQYDWPDDATTASHHAPLNLRICGERGIPRMFLQLGKHSADQVRELTRLFPETEITFDP